MLEKQRETSMEDNSYPSNTPGKERKKKGNWGKEERKETHSRTGNYKHQGYSRSEGVLTRDNET